MLIIDGGKDTTRAEKKSKTPPRRSILDSGFIGADGHKTPVSRYTEIEKDHIDKWGMPINDDSLKGRSHLSGNALEEIEPDARLLRAFGSNARNATSETKCTSSQLLGIDLKRWGSSLNSPKLQTTTELSAKKIGLVASFKELFSQDKPKADNQGSKLLDSNEDTPVRISHIINHYRQGEGEKVTELCNLVGTNNRTEIAILNDALEENKPWAREFMDIFDPSARINEALSALEDNNLFRARLLGMDDINKEQIKYLTDNPEIHEKFLNLVREQRTNAPSSSIQ